MSGSAGQIGRRIAFGADVSRPKVLVSIPTRGELHKSAAQAAVQIALAETVRGRIRGDLVMPTHVPYENNLHWIVRDVLEKGYDYWVSWDDDNPPLRNPLDLVFLDKDVIGCPTPVWHNAVPGDRPYYLNAYRQVGDPLTEEGGWKPWEETTGLQEVDAIGTGCFVIARRVLERLAEEAPFQRIYRKDGTVLVGNDLAFCLRAKAAGFRIFAHFDYLCRHMNRLDLSEVVEAFHDMREREEAARG